MSQSSWTATKDNRLERPMGDSEYAFFPASKEGLGDMFLHLAFRATGYVIRPERALNAWAVLRNRHPLLASHVIEKEDTPYFSFTPPVDVKDALEEAKRALYFRHETKEELIAGYMNGERTLSNTRLSYLVVSSSSLTSFDDAESPDECDYDLLMCAPHFTGDGTSLHQCAHDFLTLLACQSSDQGLLASIDLVQPWIGRLPEAFESRCAVPRGKLSQAASKVNFLIAREKEIGGHRLVRHQRAPQKTIFVERVFDETTTKAILRRCKENGVTINHAIEAVCGVAWARVVSAPNTFNKSVFKDPVMIYTAVNLRPHLLPSSTLDPTYWFLALTYFNLVLPSFPPTSKQAFWLRAKSAKVQTHAAVQSPFLVHRALVMAAERAGRARNTPQQKMDTQKLLNITTGNLLLERAPSAALLGLSLIGNLDATYDRRAYPGIVLKDVTTASRQKPGGILLLVHTFGGRLWLQLFYDKEGFGDNGEVERFWEEIGKGVEDFLVS